MHDFMPDRMHHGMHGRRLAGHAALQPGGQQRQHVRQRLARAWGREGRSIGGCGWAIRPCAAQWRRVPSAQPGAGRLRPRRPGQRAVPPPGRRSPHGARAGLRREQRIAALGDGRERISLDRGRPRQPSGSQSATQHWSYRAAAPHDWVVAALVRRVLGARLRRGAPEAVPFGAHVGCSLRRRLRRRRRVGGVGGACWLQLRQCLQHPHRGRLDGGSVQPRELHRRIYAHLGIEGVALPLPPLATGLAATRLASRRIRRSPALVPLSIGCTPGGGGGCRDRDSTSACASATAGTGASACTGASVCTIASAGACASVCSIASAYTRATSCTCATPCTTRGATATTTTSSGHWAQPMGCCKQQQEAEHCVETACENL